MTLLIHRGEGPGFRYAGQPVHILAGHGGQPPGFAAMEITIPGHFAGPVPHAHDEFDEAIYVLSGRLLVAGDGEPQEAAPGSALTLAGLLATKPCLPASGPPKDPNGPRRTVFMTWPLALPGRPATGCRLVGSLERARRTELHS